MLGWIRRHRVKLALAAVLTLGAAFRFYGLDWDQGHHLHPDERAIVFAAQRLSLPPPQEWSQFFNPFSTGSTDPNFFSPESPLNPKFFAYGSWPMYVVRIAAYFLGLLAPLVVPGSNLEEALLQIDSFDGLTFLGRALSAFLDLGTIYFTFLLGRKIAHRGVGLLAAAMVALTVFHIQYSHFFAVDIPLTFFVVLALYLAADFLKEGGLRRAAFLGLATGLALATKVAAAPLLLVALLASLLRWRENREPLFPALATISLSIAIAFFVAMPYALLDFPTFSSQVGEQANMVRGLLDYPYTRQYAGTIPYLYHLEQTVLWGMGPAFGLVAWGGLAYSLWRNLRGPRPMEILLLAWVVPYFLITGSFYVKFLRYLLPLFPVLYILGAQMLYAIHGRLQSWLDLRHLQRGTPQWARPLGYFGASVLLSTGFLYSVAFASVYTRPHTRAVATEWIRANLPVGAVLTCEHWDDAVPLEVNCSEENDTLGQFGVRQMALYEPDTGDKYETLKNTLRKVDYIVLSSNRLYGSIPRWPRRYPVTARYYELLFAEELGFRLAASFTSYPTLGPWTIVDDQADESFTVYDHPKVLVFAKERDLSDAQFDALFQELLDALPMAADERYWRTSKTLLLDRPVDELPVVGDVGWNEFASQNPVIAIITWWGAIQLLGLLALPPALLLFRRFADGGYILAKTLGWLLVGYVVWILVSLRLAMHVLPTYLLVMLLLGLGSAFILGKRRTEIHSILSQKKGLILISEGIFATAYLGFVGLRILNPDLWQPWTGGEKTMEFAFLNAILKSPYFPPYDPYFAHGYINYYYYGIYLVGGLIKLTGIVPSVAFNLAVPTLFAVTMVNSFSLGYNLTRRLWVGLAALAFVALLGNLDAVLQVIEGVRHWLEGGSFSGFDYWRSSRVIPFTINEFPYWSFLFADLHPHMIGIPFSVFLLSAALLLMRGSPPEDRQRFLNVEGLGQILLASLALGAVATTNLWDLPTYFLLILGVFVLRAWEEKSRRAWASEFFSTLVIWSLGLLLYYPFFANYVPLHAGLGVVQTRSPADGFFTVWGAFLFILASYLILEFRFRRLSFISNQPRKWIEVLILAVVIILYFLGELVLATLLILVSIAGFMLWKFSESQDMRFIHLLVFLGLAILLGTEIVYLRDFLQGGEYQRMNTLFKFYIQAWVLLGIGAAVLLPRLFSYIAGLRPFSAWAWRGAFSLLIIASCLFLPLGTLARVQDRFPGARPQIGTLDGLAFMTVERYTWPDENHPIEMIYDYQALQWLMQNVEGTPVVAEAALGYYREGGLRVASYTGLPTLLGMHQGEQRYDWQVGPRDGEARTFFETADLETTKELIRRLRIRYIYIGQLERIAYSAEGLAKFEALRQEGFLELVYENPRVQIYRVMGEV